MRGSRQALIARIERKREQHRSVVIEQRALVRATIRQLRRECRQPQQPMLPFYQPRRDDHGSTPARL